jgi:hypothetical protein
LAEAYQTFSEEPSRVLSEDPERRRKKKRKMLLPPPEAVVIEPDRPAHRRPSAAELLSGSPDSNVTSTSISEMLNAAQSADYFPHPSSDVDDSTVYNLEPDWAKSFQDDSAPEWIKDRMPNRAAEQPLVPSPWIDGSATLWQKIPESMQRQPGLQAAAIASDARLDTLQRKLDQMFDKMSAMDASRAESNHIELILFVLGGLFLLLLIDLLVKQGTQASFLLASAGAPFVGGGRRFHL